VAHVQGRLRALHLRDEHIHRAISVGPARDTFLPHDTSLGKNRRDIGDSQPQRGACGIWHCVIHPGATAGRAISVAAIAASARPAR
jgi:hypothetical protein